MAAARLITLAWIGPHGVAPWIADAGVIRLAQPSAEQSLPDVLAELHTRRDREQGGSGVLHVLAHRVADANLGLDRDEVGPGIDHVRDEEQPGVQPTQPVGPVDE